MPPEEDEPTVGLSPMAVARTEDLARALDAAVWAMAAEMGLELDPEPEDDTIEGLRHAWVTAYETAVIAMQEHHRFAALAGVPMSRDAVAEIDALLDQQSIARSAYNAALRPPRLAGERPERRRSPHPAP